jgi:ABC-type branched-subunit amino acid transport system substrate-binding protein
MKKVLSLVVAVSFVFILIPSLIEAVFKFIPIDALGSNEQDTIYEIIVVHKELGHGASIKQWNTIISTANYFTNSGLSDSNQFSYLGRKFQIRKFYEDQDRDIICSGLDPDSRLKNVIAILGPITSTCAKEMTEKYQQEIPVVSSFATLPALNATERKFFHRTVPDDHLRIERLLQLWKQTATHNPNNRDLIIYEGNNIYSSDSYKKVKSNLSQLHIVNEVDTDNLTNSTYDDSKRYESIFVMADQARPLISQEIRRVKKEQYANHDGHKPRFFAISENADSLLLDSPGSIVAMTPTLLSYNRLDSNTFLDVEKKDLNQRSASSFLAFEALYRAIERATKKGSQCLDLEIVEALRCGIIQHIKTSYRSELIGNKVEFNQTTGDIDMTNLVKAEIRTLGTRFTYDPPTENLPSLVSIFYKKGYQGVWLGDPVEINFESTRDSSFKVEFLYTAPSWIPNGYFKKTIEDLFSFTENFLANERQFSFHPYFMGVYSVEVTGLGADLRQSAGKHEISIVPPRGLFIMIFGSLVIAIIVSVITPPANQRLNKRRLVLEVVSSAIFLYFMTVTLRGFNLPGAPTLSFSSEPVTNLVYCAVIAGTVRMKIFVYFINPIIKRFTPIDTKLVEPEKKPT